MRKKRTTKDKPSVQEKMFVQELLKPGRTQTEAYQAVVPQASYETAAVMGSTYMSRPRVQEHIKEVLAKKYPELATTAADVIMGYLVNPEIAPQTKLKCIELLAKFSGWIAPQRTENLHAKVDLTRFRLPGTGENE